MPSIEIHPLYNEIMVTSTLRHPRVYPHIIDDSCPAAEDFNPTFSDAFTYLEASEGEEYLGLFMVHPHSAFMWEVHTCLLPNAWGPRALQASKALIQWVFENTSCQRLITSVPQGNTLALRLARNAGMTVYGINPKSLQRGGKLIDQTLLGLNK